MRRITVTRAAVTLLAASLAVPTQAATLLESSVLANLNRMRADPAGYARQLLAYRRFYHGKVVLIPGDAVHHITVEGVAPLDEAVAFLGARHALGALAPDASVYASASAYLAEQVHSGAVGHIGRDGSTPPDRIRARGGGGMVAEVIVYGALDAADVIRQLMIDDGVVDRGHRFVLFEPNLRFAGIACGSHPRYGMSCVLDFAGAVGVEAGSETPEVEPEPEIERAPSNPQAIETPDSAPPPEGTEPPEPK